MAPPTWHTRPSRGDLETGAIVAITTHGGAAGDTTSVQGTLRAAGVAVAEQIDAFTAQGSYEVHGRGLCGAVERALRPRPVLTAPNQEWAVDFVSDVAASGRRLRIFTVVDSYTRECLALELDTSLPSRRVTRALAEIIDRRGAPAAIRSDNVLNASCFFENKYTSRMDRAKAI
jgi:transposase InsO family protein